METWIALLRGVNVGGKNILQMKELVKLLESKGFNQVRTYIQSGNVVFQTSSKPKFEIGQLIEERFGFKPSVFVLSCEELKKAAANNPFHHAEGKTVHFFFCEEDPKFVDYELLASLKSDLEEYKLIGNIFYLHAPNGIGRSKLVSKISRAIPDVTMTARNLNTINKLLEMTD